LDEARVQGIVRGVLREFSAELTPILQSFEQRLASQPAPAAPAAGGGDDPTEAIWKQPREFVQQIVAENMRQLEQKIAPYLNNSTNFMRDRAKADVKAAVDAEYGEGVFGEMVEAQLDPVLDTILRTNPSALTPDSVQAAVATIIGHPKYRQSFREKAAAAEQARAEANRREPPSLLPPGGGALHFSGTPDVVKEYVRGRNAEGANLEPERFLKVHTAGPKLSDWVKATGAKPNAA
jgi:hypothetical protein